MATTLTIPDPITVGNGTLIDYIYNNNSSAIQTLFNDTDWTTNNHMLYYKTMPVLIAPGYSYIRLVDEWTIISTPDSTNMRALTGNTSANIYIYDFNTFMIIIPNWPYTHFTDESVNYAQDPKYCVLLLDKTNMELHNILSYDSYGQLIGGTNSVTIGASGPIYSRTVLCDLSGQIGHSEHITTLREVSATECTFYRQLFYNGDTSARVYFMTKFPTNSCFQTIHVGNRYLFVLPYFSAMHNIINNVNMSQECWCAIAIDVTDDLAS